MTRDDVLQHLAQLAAAVDLPINADFESGFAASPEGVASNVALAVDTGIAGLSIEDTDFDYPGELYDLDVAVERIRAARAAIDQTGHDVVLVARTEHLLHDGTVRSAGLHMLIWIAIAISFPTALALLGAFVLSRTMRGSTVLRMLFFLPYIAPSLSSVPVIDALTRGLPSWDLSLFGPAGHGNALFFSALVPLALLAIGYGFPKARPVLAGIAVGVAAHLAFFAVVPLTAVHYMPSIFGLGSIWLVVNAVACLVLARLALRR